MSEPAIRFKDVTLGYDRSPGGQKTLRFLVPAMPRDLTRLVPLSALERISLLLAARSLAIRAAWK